LGNLPVYFTGPLGVSPAGALDGYALKRAIPQPTVPGYLYRG